MFARFTRTGVLALATAVSMNGAAAAQTIYDGQWSLTFVTQRGACDPTYNFTVMIVNGIVSHPNIVQFRGRVTPNGSVRASVRVEDKVASGAGRLGRSAGQGQWAGYAGNARCAGVWMARRQ